MHRWLRSAVSLALTHQYDERLSFQLCAVIVRGGNIIATGYNKRNRNSFVEYACANSAEEKDYPINTHAEMAAILSARNRTDLAGSKIFVARVKPSGVGCARPCDACQFALERYGIRRAFYTISDNEYGVLKL